MAHLVARVGKAHGLRGEVTVQVHTDSPEERFVPGAVFADEAGQTAYTLRSARLHNGIWLLAFEGTNDRSAAEALRGVRLHVPEDGDDEDDDDAWYEEDLVGLQVVDPSGAVLGTVTGLEVRPAQDLLGIALTDGRTGQVPFVAELVPEVDVNSGRVVVAAPPGLFDLFEV